MRHRVTAGYHNQKDSTAASPAIAHSDSEAIRNC